MRICSIFIFIFLIQCSGSRDSTDIKKYSIGEDTVGLHLTVYYPLDSSVSFINLHDDENTSVKAGEDFLSKYGGSLLQLQHSGKRHVTFILNGQSFSFDPNRIFTSNGLKATLKKLSVYRQDAAIEVKKFAESILKNYVDNRKLVITLHNNTERGLSILSYKKGQHEAKNAARVFTNPQMNPHNFILTTETNFFRYLKQRKLNVVLQHHKPHDDGSLSVYAGKKKIPYINIEALHGHLDEQTRMLEVLKDIIFRY